MILKASQRAGAKQLALHLLRTDENDHVEVHELRGFAADDLVGALREAYAISQGTKCRQYLFSVSLSPPADEKVDVAAFEKAIRQIEERTGLAGQPRAIVFHEKNGRRHAHCVWSRIGVRAKEVEAKLGDPVSVPAVGEVMAAVADKVDKKLARFASDERADFETVRTGLVEKRNKLVEWQRHERQVQAEMQIARWMHEARDRAERFRTGLRGLWDRITGRHADVQKRNMVEAEQAKMRDRAERQALIDQQLQERRELQRQIKAQHDRLERNLAELRNKDRPSPIQNLSLEIGERPARRRNQRPSLTP